jgi:hypothetical protein
VDQSSKRTLSKGTAAGSMGPVMKACEPGGAESRPARLRRTLLADEACGRHRCMAQGGGERVGVGGGGKQLGGVRADIAADVPGHMVA